MQTAMPKPRRGLFAWLEDRGPLLVAAFVTLPLWYAGFDKPDWFYPPGYCLTGRLEYVAPPSVSADDTDRIEEMIPDGRRWDEWSE